MGSGGLTLGPLACVTRTLPTELCPQPSALSRKGKSSLCKKHALYSFMDVFGGRANVLIVKAKEAHVLNELSTLW